MKLKKLLEGYAWERKDGQSLPTLNDVQKKYNEKISEAPIQYNPNDYESAKLNKGLGDEDPEVIVKLLEDAEDELNLITSNMSTDSNLSTTDKVIYLASLRKINYIINRLQARDLSSYYE